MSTPLTPEQLDGVATRDLVQALKRRSKIFVATMMMRDGSPEANCRQYVEIERGNALVALGMTTLLHRDVTAGAANAVYAE